MTSGTEFALRFDLQVRTPHSPLNLQINSPVENNTRKFVFDPVPMPIQKVNYVIKALNAKQGSEYIVLEVWTDGSVLPQETVQFALRNLTHLFFQFADVSRSTKNFVEPTG